MKCIQTKPTRSGLITYEDVPVRHDSRQRALAYLHILGLPRDRPSSILHIFVGPIDKTADIDLHAPENHPGYATEHVTYTSPPSHRAAGLERPAHSDGPLARVQESAEEIVDISTRADSLHGLGRVTVSFAALQPNGLPSTADLDVEDLYITTRSPKFD